MWQSDVGFVRYEQIRVEDGIVMASKPYTSKRDAVLWPFKSLALPTHFAKVRDAKSAISFERNYAPLGHDQLVKDFQKERKGGDPLDWVLEHAKFVRFALNLEYALALQDEQGAIKLIDSEKTKASYPSRHDQITYPMGAYSNERVFQLHLHTGKESLWLAQSIITNMVTGNTKNIHQELQVNHDGRLIWMRKVRALIEVVWYMVGDLAIKTQLDAEKKYFRRCDWCRTPFLADDKRQKFCPPIEGLAGRRQSLCGLRSRQHKLQSKQKGDKK